MFEFIEFLRVIAIGFMSLALLGLIFYKSIFGLDATWIAMISAILGLILQPFLRAYHPFRKEIKRVIKHVEIYMGEALSGEMKSELIHDSETENALARAIYEYCIRTFASAETFTVRVNEQIRFFYFYYFISVALKASSLGILLVFSIKGIAEYTNFLRFSPLVLRIVKDEFLMGIQGVFHVSIVTTGYMIVALLLARRFFATAKGIMLNELDTRHVFLLEQKKKIQELARSAQNDEILVEIFKQKVDKEKGLRQ